MQNTFKRKLLALAAVLLLSVPSAIGVQHALAPTRGDVAGWLAAAGFEAVYLSTAILILTSDLRHYAQRVALAAVGAAVLLNTIADYSTRVPGGLTNYSAFVAGFDGLALGLSLVESLPLAGLAYAMATLLHRLAEDKAPALTAAPIPALAQSSAETARQRGWLVRKHRLRLNGGSFSKGEWRDLCAKFNHRCVKCGAKRHLSADHIIPVARGGSSDIGNIQPLCRRCNSAKGARSTRDYRDKPHYLCNPKATEMPTSIGISEIRDTVLDRSCPQCGAALSAAAYGAAQRWGYCNACKADTISIISNGNGVEH